VVCDARYPYSENYFVAVAQPLAAAGPVTARLDRPADGGYSDRNSRIPQKRGSEIEAEADSGTPAA
jgi:hypothetical protein